jgi:hypothetical protein
VGVERYANSHGRSAVSGVAVHDGVDAAGSVDRWKYDCIVMARVSSAERSGGSVIV